MKKYLIDANLPYYFSTWNTEAFIHVKDLNDYKRCFPGKRDSGQDDGRRCLNCGRDLSYRPNRRAKYCSAVCRQGYYRGKNIPIKYSDTQSTDETKKSTILFWYS